MVRLHMASTHNAVVVSAVAVDSSNSDIELAHRAAALLTFLQPRKTSVLAVHEMLDQLGKEKIERESRGLNHWDKHAPQFLSLIVRQARSEKRRRHQEAEAFFRPKHREAVRFALAIVGSTAAAEIVVAETYRELLEGGTPVANFFTALVGNARNYLARASYRQEKFLSPEEAFTPNYRSSDSGEGDEESFALEPASHHLEDQDPLDILIAREDEEQRRQMVMQAKEDPRWRYIKLREWAAPLREDVRN